MSAPANLFDVRYLTGLAFKTMIEGLTGFQVLIEGDRAEKVRPCVLVRLGQNEEQLKPGCGIYKQKVEIELQTKLDPTTSDEAAAEVLAVRQCFYRNDTNPDPMKDLAIRLGQAVANPYSVMGVVPIDEGAVIPDQQVRTYSYRLILDVFCTPTR